MKFIQNLWRSTACLIISALGMGLLLIGAIKVTPYLFQDGVWAKIGILAVGIEIGMGVLYFAMMLITGAISGIAQHWKTPAILAMLPIIYTLIRYPWWLISTCNALPFSFGFLQWLIIIAWIAAWIIILLMTLGALYSNMNDSQYDK